LAAGHSSSSVPSWGAAVSLAGLQPGNGSVANELARRTKHCSSPGTILSSMVGEHKTLNFGKEQMSLVFGYLL
jgi:hypothetical protein